VPGFCAFLFGDRFWKFYSVVLCALLRWRWNVEVGKGVEIRGIPQLKLKGEQGGRAVRIGDHVTIFGSIDLRTRERGVIEFKDHSVVERGCRFVAANDAVLSVGEGAVVTEGAIINAGTDLSIGDQAVIGPRASINSSDHEIVGTKPIRELGFSHAPIQLGAGCWLGANVVVMKGVVIGEGAVVGASAVVTKDLPAHSISVGIPAKVIGMRRQAE